MKVVLDIELIDKKTFGNILSNSVQIRFEPILILENEDKSPSKNNELIQLNLIKKIDDKINNIITKKKYDLETLQLICL